MTAPLDLDAISPVALWRGDYAEGDHFFLRESNFVHRGEWKALPTETFASLVAELRAARDAMAAGERAYDDMKAALDVAVGFSARLIEHQLVTAEIGDDLRIMDVGTTRADGFVVRKYDHARKVWEDASVTIDTAKEAVTTALSIARLTLSRAATGGS